jgi:hypothetical protein
MASIAPYRIRRSGFYVSWPRGHEVTNRSPRPATSSRKFGVRHSIAFLARRETLFANFEKHSRPVHPIQTPFADSLRTSAIGVGD